jgi:hypothetical protein
VTDKKQDTKPEDSDPRPVEEKQTTPTGLEIPVPTRDEIMDVFRRFVLLKPKR